MIEIEHIEKCINLFVDNYLKKGFEFRENQKEAIISIIDNILNGNTPTHVIEAPTGSGKSLINIISAGVLAKYYNRHSFILASDVSLWDQYADFIKKNPKLSFIGMLKGKDNYICKANGQHIDSAECKLAGLTMGQLMCESPEKLGFPCARTCTYLRDRKKALAAPVTLLTYALYLRTVDSNNMDNQIQCFDARDVVFCDECHNIPNIIQLRYQKGLNRKDISWCAALYKYAGNIINQFSLFDDEGESIQEEYKILLNYFPTEQDIYNDYNVLYDKLIDYRKTKDEDYNLICELNNFWDLFYPIKNIIEESLKLKSKAHIKLTEDEKAILRICRLFQGYVSNSSIKMLIEIYDTVGHEYIVKNLVDINDGTDKHIDLQCAKEDYMTYMGLLSVTPKHVMVSATVGDKDNFDENIGLKYTDYLESKMEWIDSTFNFDNSPIYFLNRYKMNFSEKEKSLAALKPIIYKLCKKYENQKGIIQTGTYAIAKDIIDNAPIEIRKRLLYYNGSKEKSDVIIQHQMSADTILIGPTLNEGIDLPGDLCRFIIITKMPYPSIKDRLVDAKMKIFPYWYNSTTSTQIIQGIGRGNRFEDDYCSTYILDACFLKLYTDTQSQYPTYIQRRIKVCN